MTTLTSIDNVPTLTETILKAVERKYVCQLPEDYRRFVLRNNGCYPTPDCVAFMEAGRRTESDVFCFFAIHDDRPWLSMEWHLEACAGRMPKNTLPIARDSCGNLWLLNVGSEHAGSVYFWDHGSYNTFDETDLKNWPLVAASFEEFRESLGTAKAFHAGNSIPNRYALVKQASEVMSQRNGSFSTRANPGYVWHCDCDDDGNVNMQFIQYEIHAITTHTDGYARLLAINGLINPGNTRLPE